MVRVLRALFLLAAAFLVSADEAAQCSKKMDGCVLCAEAGGLVLQNRDDYRVIEVRDAGTVAYRRVIWNSHVREMSDLTFQQRQMVMEEVFKQEEELKAKYHPDKMNVASLGNMVPHIHWHVIPRFKTDQFWPASIWSKTQPETEQKSGLSGLQVRIAHWAAAEAPARQIRTEVFVQEQNITSEEEFDGLDEVSRHVVATVRNTEVSVATARLLSLGNGTAKVGRLAVLKDHRKQGYGAEVLKAIVDEAKRLRFDSIVLDAQVHALEFYQKLGFQPEGTVFQDCRIDHQRMRLPL